MNISLADPRRALHDDDYCALANAFAEAQAHGRAVVIDLDNSQEGVVQAKQLIRRVKRDFNYHGVHTKRTSNFQLVVTFDDTPDTTDEGGA